jgi:hypothetical protein
MSDNSMELYLIQSPDLEFPNQDPDSDPPADALRYLSRYYNNSMPVRDTKEFVGRVLLYYFQQRRLVKKLIIGSHGAGLPPYRAGISGTGHFFIGKDYITTEEGDRAKLESLRLLAPLFSRDADIYIMACRTGFDEALLRRVSQVLGGVRVHGYTDYVTVTNYGLFETLDDGTDDGGKHVVCWPSVCLYTRNWPEIRKSSGW